MSKQKNAISNAPDIHCPICYDRMDVWKIGRSPHWKHLYCRVYLYACNATFPEPDRLHNGQKQYALVYQKIPWHSDSHVVHNFNGESYKFNALFPVYEIPPIPHPYPGSEQHQYNTHPMESYSSIRSRLERSGLIVPSKYEPIDTQAKPQFYVVSPPRSHREMSDPELKDLIRRIKSKMVDDPFWGDDNRRAK